MIQTDNINLIWASLMVEECIRKGADTFFLAPGSRCTPLTLAVARHPDARVVQHVDERALGFAALGFARATGRPGIVICTSGTAVSNLTPSVVEASMDSQPLLLLTADRPFELRECGANQSIPQVNAFSSYVRWEMDLPAPEVSVPPQVVLTTVDEALSRAETGPVHLNCPFREPLAAFPDRTDAEAYLIPVHNWTTGHDPYTSRLPVWRETDEMIISGLADLLVNAKVLVVAGGGCNESEVLAIDQLSEKWGWPIISDVSSGLHFGPRRTGVVRHIDSVLGGSDFPPSLVPDVLIQFGCRFLSKRLMEALDDQPPATWIQVTPRTGRFDPVHRVTHRIQAGIDRFCLQLEQERKGEPDTEWKLGWLQADLHVERVLKTELEEGAELSEPVVARCVTRQIRNLHGLVLGASMPVRDVNRFSARNPNRIQVTCNRGASGIDGTIATAVGFARGLRQSVTVLLGDLATLHDLNSLAMVAMSRTPVIVIVINNHGGGIFHFLPQSADESFETFFGTPHEWRFESAADQFGLPYAYAQTLEDFEETYEEALERQVSCLIEVETNRNENHQLHERLEEMLAIPHLRSGSGR